MRRVWNRPEEDNYLAIFLAIIYPNPTGSL